MALRHPTLDPLLADFQALSKAISLLRRRQPSTLDPVAQEAWDKVQEDKKTNVFTKDVAGDVHAERAKLKELLNTRDGYTDEGGVTHEGLQHAIARVAEVVRQERDADDHAKCCAEAEKLHGKCCDEDLAAAIVVAQQAVVDADAALRLLQLEASRRRGLIKAQKQLDALSPVARRLLAQQISVSATPSTTKVNEPGT